MAFESGTRVGPYEITGELGAGGMGEVYRATDSNLRRDVAIKVLPQAFADDPQRLARFEREAQLLAALNHTNIAGIYGIEESGGNRCLILELVEGNTLAELIAAGPLPLERAIPLALQIAEALEAAHDKGVVHRDLKPANIKVTPEGQVKVLDFGLAKAFADDGGDSAPDLTHSPTLTMAATQAGMILGTAAYMSPEQAAGQKADRRSDIWSFGVVLFEMLAGSQLFQGETVSHTLASVLKDGPDWERLPAGVPPRLHELLERCLKKKPRQRLQAIGDARIVLEAWVADPAALEAPAAVEPPVPVARRGGRAVWIVTAALALAWAVSLAVLWPRPAAPRVPVRAAIPLPPSQPLFRGYGSSVILSPDGSTLAYVVTPDNRERGLYVRALDQTEGIALASDLAPYNPFFSPDGAWIGFVTREALYKVPVTGGAPIKLTEVTLNRGASWGEDGFIVFAPEPASGLFRVSDSGGAPERLTDAGERGSHRWPQVLPGAKAVLYTANDEADAGDFFSSRIEVVKLDSGERKVVYTGGTYGRYVASGHLVFANGTSLFAAAFDLDSLSIVGPVVPVLDGVATSAAQGGALFDVASDGRLVYVAAGAEEAGMQLLRVDRAGQVTPLTDDQRLFGDPELSPDGKSLAVNIRAEGKFDVWIYDLERQLATRITSGVGDNYHPIWSPDGKWIYYAAGTGRDSRIERIAADGSGQAETVVGNDVAVSPRSVSPDGTRLLYMRGSVSLPDLYSVTLGSGEPEPFVATPHVDYEARFSPDGRWVAYATNESGEYEVYVVPASGGGGRWQVSDGGAYPRWSGDGSSLFYRDIVNGDLYEVPLQTGSATLRAQRPRLVMKSDAYYFDAGPINYYAVAADGQSFVLMRREGADAKAHEHVELIVGWDEVLRKAARKR